MPLARPPFCWHCVRMNDFPAPQHASIFQRLLACCVHLIVLPVGWIVCAGMLTWVLPLLFWLSARRRSPFFDHHGRWCTNTAISYSLWAWSVYIVGQYPMGLLGQVLGWTGVVLFASLYGRASIVALLGRDLAPVLGVIWFG